MSPQRILIVNADDFGCSPGVNRGIIEAHEHGIVTSGSLMVRWPAAADAAGYGRAHDTLSVGLHIDLGEWAYSDGAWVRVYEVVAAEDARAVAEEVDRQLLSFHRLVRSDPTHLDSHQHFHREDPLRSVLQVIADRLGIPLRHFCPYVRYCGEFYGQTNKGEPYPQGIGVEGLVRVLRRLPPGVTELGCHPGKDNDVDSTYGRERSEELTTLRDPRVHDAILEENIQLCSFRDIRADGQLRT
jgi:chitin disaccharide deacetylase